MTLAKYEILGKVVETGNLTKAAEQLSLTQSAVSRAIISLEQELGIQILARGRSGVRLSHDGERLWGYMKEMLQLHENMLQEADQIKGLLRGTVTIGTFTSISIHWLPDILHRFQQKYPQIEIRLLDGHYHDIERWIADGTADFGFVNMPSSHGLETRTLIRDLMMCVLPAGHKQGMKSAISLEDIADEPFIMPAKGCDTDVRAWFDGQRAAPRVRFELEDDHAIMAMVRSGLGVSILPETILASAPAGLVVRPLSPEASRSIALAAVSFKKCSPAASRAISCIVEMMGAQKSDA
ncbi:DNA-binding transcriptional LysR family regulator [Paenibacillus rhizosphaerae]|uniref:DNA-binding transcriptional LysR family regulator n=1 Tax=Paenibacillus rhizosphaerae TaxID=297318 RepID=A0A839TJ67_9BACL|nr:LysR substrate-binding domain-containing protein [Paenibacillus rhizosphaerae]MBB3126721.1 DNA-binding transcriptional LysR family regulator [Paenibacillus rhizosphaerae]